MAGVDEYGMDSSAEVSDSGIGNIGIHHLAGSISDEDMDLGQTPQESIDFL